MASRLKLHEVLCEILNNNNVYYQPPESIKMNYPAIKYSLGVPDVKFANDKKYSLLSCYDLIVISRSPDPEFVKAILDLPYTSMSKPYVADNLNHYPIKIYY